MSTSQEECPSTDWNVDHCGVANLDVYDSEADKDDCSNSLVCDTGLLCDDIDCSEADSCYDCFLTSRCCAWCPSDDGTCFNAGLNMEPESGCDSEIDLVFCSDSCASVNCSAHQECGSCTDRDRSFCCAWCETDKTCTDLVYHGEHEWGVGNGSSECSGYMFDFNVTDELDSLWGFGQCPKTWSMSEELGEDERLPTFDESTRRHLSSCYYGGTYGSPWPNLCNCDIGTRWRWTCTGPSCTWSQDCSEEDPNMSDFPSWLYDYQPKCEVVYYGKSQCNNQLVTEKYEDAIQQDELEVAYIELMFFVLQDDDGTNSLVDDVKIQDQISILNSYYEPYKIQFRGWVTDVKNSTLRIHQYSSCSSVDKIGNGECDDGCNTGMTGYDGGDCDHTNSGCSSSSIGDGTCNNDCNLKAYQWDGGDCCDDTTIALTNCRDPNHRNRMWYTSDELRSYLGLPDGNKHLNIFIANGETGGTLGL